MAEETYLHSVKILKELCHGCTYCVTHCPTQAMRVRRGKAEIIANRCIDCGTCVRSCSFHAAVADTDKLSDLAHFQYNIVLPAPSLYAQFSERVTSGVIWQSLHDLGFNEIFDVALASEFVAQEIERYVKQYKGKRRPLLSCSCPAVLRLIQVKFPELIKQIIPLLPPAEAAAIYIKNKVAREKNLPKEAIGVWFISPCPSKGANIRQSVDVVHTEINGYFSVSAIYALIMKNLSKLGSGERVVTAGSSYGMEWGAAGGELAAAGLKNALAVHGLDAVYEMLEQISLNKVPSLDYVECSACQSGCIGGPLVAENKFVAETNLQQRITNMRRHEPGDRLAAMQASMAQCPDFPASGQFVKILQPRPMMQLDDDIMEAMKKFEQMEDVLRSLPGLDCGACGAPSCQCLAEDIVQGKAHEIDCIFKLRSQVKKIAHGMFELSKQLPMTDAAADLEEEEADKHAGK